MTVGVVTLVLPFRGFAEVLIGVNFFQTELLFFQPAMKHTSKDKSDYLSEY